MAFQLNDRDFSELSDNKDLGSDSDSNVETDHKSLDDKEDNSYADSIKEQREKLHSR